MPKTTFLNLDKEKKDRVINSALAFFSEKPYEQVMISDIIKKAKIPRGSFYQYFEDKEDLYLYLLNLIQETKLEFLGPTLQNIANLSFLQLTRKLFEEGVKFALARPIHVKILDLLLKNKNEIYQKVLAESMQMAETIYANLIDQDKEKGLIRKDIDTHIFARMILELTSNIAIDELDINNPEASFKRMLEKNDKILQIIEYGVKEG